MTTFRPVTLDAKQVPRQVVDLVEKRVNPLLHDVHWMLSHPRPGTDGEPAFNLSAAQVLCAIVGGLSRFFCNDKVTDKDAFTAALEYYPIDEANGSLSGPGFANELYHVYRCNLVHALGMNTFRQNNTSRWKVEAYDESKKVTRHEVPLSDVRLSELNQRNRPKWLEPTLSRRGGVVRLNVDSLYWGVRRLVMSLATDRTRQHEAKKVLEPALATEVENSTVSSTNFAVTNIFPAPMSINYHSTSYEDDEDDG